MFNFLVIVATLGGVYFALGAVCESLDLYTEHCNEKSYEHCYEKSIKKSEGITIKSNRSDLWSAVTK